MLALLRKNMSRLVICLSEIAIALLLFINPEGFTTGIVIAFGLALIAFGALQIFRYIKLPPIAAAEQHLLAKGITMLMLGVFLALRNGWILQFFPLLAVLYGTAMLVCAVLRLQWTIDLLRIKHTGWKMTAVSAAATMVLALLILFHPVFIQSIMWSFVAVSLLVGAVLDAVNLFLLLRAAKQNP